MQRFMLLFLIDAACVLAEKTHADLDEFLTTDLYCADLPTYRFRDSIKLYTILEVKQNYANEQRFL